MDKDTKEMKRSDLNPMSTAPMWNYSNDAEDRILLFVEYEGEAVPLIAYYDRVGKYWVDWYYEKRIKKPLVGWLPYFKIVE